MNSKIVLGALYSIYLILTIVSSFYFINGKTVENYKQDLQAELGQISQITAYLVDRDSLSFLVDNLKNKNRRAVITSSDEFKKIQNQLFFVNKNYESKSSWSYIYYPKDDKTVYLTVPTADGVTYAELYDISPYPNMIRSIRNTETIITDITYDETYKVWVMSAFTPIYKDKEYLGNVGVDMFLSDYEKRTEDIRVYSILLTIAVIFIGGILLPIAIFYITGYFGSEKFKSSIKKMRIRRAIKKAKKDNHL